MITFDSELVFGMVSTAIGAVGIVAGLREMARAADSEDWPVAEGEVEETGVLMEPGDRGGTLYAPMVRYHYRIGDTQYVGNRIAFGGLVSTSFRSWAQGVVERYRNQKAVHVRFCPDDPDLSVLEPGVHWSGWMIPLVSAGFFGFGLRTLLAHFGLLGSLPFRLR